MGWSFNTRPQTKAQYIEEELHRLSPGYAVLKESTVGNHHWQLVQAPDGRKYISLCLLEQQGGCWGHKGMDESCGPNADDCPLSFLDAADPAPNEWAANFRTRVRAYHAERAARRTLGPGSRIEYGGAVYKLVENLGRKGWTVTRVSDGTGFRMTCQQFNDAKALDAPTPAPAPTRVEPRAEQDALF